MINCKVVNKLHEVESLVDLDNGFKIETNILTEFNTTITDIDGVYAYIEHDNIEIAKECHVALSKAIHF